MANEVEITITSRDLTDFPGITAKMLAMRKVAQALSNDFAQIGVGGFDINKAGAYLVQLRSKIQALGIADLADVNVPQGKIITQLAILKRIVAASGISDLIDMNVNPAEISTQLDSIASMSETIPVNFKINQAELAAELSTIKAITASVEPLAITAGTAPVSGGGPDPLVGATDELTGATQTLGSDTRLLNATTVPLIPVTSRLVSATDDLVSATNKLTAATLAEKQGTTTIVSTPSGGGSGGGFAVPPVTGGGPGPIDPSTLSSWMALTDDTYKLNAGLGDLRSIINPVMGGLSSMGNLVRNVVSPAWEFWGNLIGNGSTSLKSFLTPLVTTASNLTSVGRYVNMVNNNMSAFTATLGAAIGSSGGGGGGKGILGFLIASGNAGNGLRGWGGILTATLGGIALWHVALDGAIEALIIVGTSAAAAAVGIAAMAPAAHNVYDGMNSLYEVSVALNKTIYPLSGNFNALTKSLAPQVVGDFGGALNLVNQNLGTFDQTAREVSDLFSGWIAKLDLWSQAQGGVNKLLQTGVGFLTQFGTIAGNMLTAITNISRADPGTAHFLMDIFVGASDLFTAISKLPGPVLQLGIAFHSMYVWGSVATGLLSHMPGVIGNVAGAIAGLPTPIKLALAAAAAISIELAGQWESASASVSKSISSINTSLSTMSASSAIVSISQDIGTLNSSLSDDSVAKIQASWTNLSTIWQQADANIQNLGSDLGKTVSGNSFMSQLSALGKAAQQVGILIHAAVSGDVSGLNNQGAASTQLANDFAQVSAKIKNLVGDQAALLHATGTLVSGDNTLHLGHLSLVQSFGLLDAAGVRATDTYAVMMQKVQNLVTGYSALTGGGTGLINSINAVSFATLQGDSHVAALNTGWDTFLQTISGGVSGLVQFQGALVTMASAGQITVKSLDGVTTQTVALANNFQTAYAAANTEADGLTLLANASGGGNKAVGELNQGVKDYVALLLPAAKGSSSLTDELYALAQRGGYQGADSFKALSTWVSNTQNPMASLKTITDKLTASAANLKTDVANLSVALGQTLNNAMATVIETESGGLKPMENLYTAIAETSVNSGRTQQAALALGNQFLTLTGNTKDAHSEFDTFAHEALGLTITQADTLWSEISGKLTPVVANSGKTAAQAAATIDSTYIKSLQQIGFDTPGINHDIGLFSTAIIDTGNSSTRTVGARAKLIQDLENAGVQANTAKNLVKTLQAQIDAMKGKTVGVHVVGSGSGTITFAEQNIKNAQTGLLEFHAAGGPVRGPGGPKSDSIPAMLSPGEFVINAASARNIGYGNLYAMNKMASGGIADAPNWMGDQEVYAGRQAENTAAASMVSDMRAKVAAEVAAAKAMAALNYLPLGPQGPLSASAATAQAFARSILFAYGWTQAQWPYELALWNRESGWNAYAANPTSDARGIPQNINGWSAYAPGDYQAQIRWGDAYISSRYGNPANAWAHETAYNWYDNGGWLKPGMNMMMNGTGGWEHLSRDTGGSGSTQLVVSGGSSDFEQFMVKMIRKYVKVRTGGNTQRAFGSVGNVSGSSNWRSG